MFGSDRSIHKTLMIMLPVVLLICGTAVVVNGFQVVAEKKNPFVDRVYGSTCSRITTPKSKQTSAAFSPLSLKRKYKSRLYASPTKSRTVEKTEEEWQSILTPEEFNVLRKEGTEAPWASPLNDISKDQNGTFTCSGCGTPLFRASSKFDSGTGWPSFVQPLDNTVLDLETDFKLVLPRTECTCATCGGHLGHVFPDGPEPTGQRYCINGVALKFIADDDDENADPEMVADVIAREAMTSTEPLKPKPLAILPTALLYTGLAVSYANNFVTRYQQVGGDAHQQMSTFDYFPLAMASACVFFAARDLRRLF